jgi:RNA polymerase sigma factor (sigma-70 family)
MQQIERSKAELNSIIVEAQSFARRFGQIGTYEPEDIAQMALMKVLKRPDIKQVNKAWLYKVVRSAAFDAGRKHARDTQFLSPIEDLQTAHKVCERADEEGIVYLSRNRLTSHDALDLDLTEQLKTTMQRLTQPLRKVLVLYAQGYSYEHIAQVTNANIGTVRSRLHHARKRARRLLDNLG